MSVDEDLKIIGFGEDEASVYEVLAIFGFRTAGQVEAYLNKSHSKITSILDKLEFNGFVKKLKTKNPEANLYFPIAPQIAFSANISKKLQNNLSTLNLRVIQQWQTTELAIDSKRKKLQQDIITKVNQLIETVSLQIEKQELKVNSFKTNEAIEIDTATKVVQENIKELMSTPLTQVVENVKNKKLALQTFQKEATENLTKAKATQMKVLETSTRKFKGDNSKFFDQFNQKLTKSADKAKLFTVKLKEKKQAELELAIKALNEQLETEAMKQVELIDTTHETQMNAYTQFVNHDGKKFDELISKAKNEMFQTKKVAKQQFVKVEEDTLQATTDVFLKFQESLNKNAKGLQQEMVSITKNMKQTCVETLSEMLDKTATDLENTQGILEKVMMDGQASLNAELKKLNKALNNSMRDKLTEVESKTMAFNRNLSKSTTKSVSQLSSNVTMLAKFIEDFLATTHLDLKEKLTGLEKTLRKQFTMVADKNANSVDKFNLERKDKIDRLEKQQKDCNSAHIEKLKVTLDLQKKNFEDALGNSHAKFTSKLSNEVIEFEENTSLVYEAQLSQLNEIDGKTGQLETETKRKQQEFATDLQTEAFKIKGEAFSSFSKNIEIAYFETQAEILELQEKSGKQLEEFGVSFKNSISDLADSIPGKIDELFINHNDKLQSFELQFSSFKIRMDGYLSELVDYLEKNPKAASKDKKQRETKINEIRLLYSDFARLVDGIEPFIQAEKESSQSYREEVVTQLNRTVQYEIQTVRDILASTGENFANLINDIDGNTNDSRMEFVGKFSTNMDSLLQSTVGSVTSLSEKFKKESLDVLEQIKQTINQKPGGSGNYAPLERQKNLDKRLIIAVKSYRDKVENNFSTTVKGFTEFFDQEREKSSKLIDTFESEFQGNLETEKDSIDNFTDQLKNMNSKLSKSANSATKESITGSIKEIKSVTTDKVKEIKVAVASNISTLKSETSKNLKKISTDSTKFGKDLTKMQDKTKVKLDSTIFKTQELLAANIGNLLESSESVITEAKNDLSSSKLTLEKQVEKPLSETVEDLNQLLKTFAKDSTTSKQKIRDLLGNIKVAATQNFDQLANYQSSIEATTEQAEKEKHQLLKNLSSKLKSSLLDIKAKLKIVVAEQTQSLNQLYSNEVEGASKQVNELSSKYVETMENLKLNSKKQTEERKVVIKNLLKDFNSTQQTTVLDSATPILNFLKHDFVLLNENLETLVQTIQRNQVEMNNSIDKNFQENATDLSKRVAKILDSYLNQAKAEIQTEVSGLAPKAKTFSEEAFEISEAGKLEVQNSINEIPNIITEALDAAGHTIKLLSEISKGVITRSIEPIEDTYIEATEEAIKAGLNGLLRRTKSKIDIVSPHLHWIDPSQFETFSRKTINIITDPTQHGPEDKAIIEKIRESGTPLILRRFDNARIGSRVGFNVILVSRDGEELMIAETFDADKVYGIITQNEKFVAHFSSILANFQSMPKMF